ncbi:MAG: transcriptional repressor, partial [Candidatus Delongbacteria bacterium]|nr:transcriptional repressor [Candidatus Delongbacteria bacterium]MCG2759700.1 transcriptional repressor [Candidatus Delongbacteria bacterium]
FIMYRMEKISFEYYLKKLEIYLRKNRLRNTSSRISLLKFLCNSENGLHSHFEADEAATLLIKKDIGVSRASVFRNLSFFSEIEILRKSKFGENHFHYELLSTEKNYHHHLICKNCGSFIEFENNYLQNFSKKIAKQNDFEISDYRFEAFGYCHNCKKGKNV